MKRRLRLDLAYDGTDFAGWQMQRGRPTIQAVVEATLARLAGDRRVVVRAAGRTDAGVHARRQVCDFVFEGTQSAAELEHALHRMLPASIRPLGAREIDDAFDAQRSARAKVYRYRLDRSAYGDPTLGRFALHYPHPLDEERAVLALSPLTGTHDWSGFTASKCEIEDRTRTLTHACFERRGAEAIFEFEGDGFLTHMVRNIVGTVLEIASGKRPVEDVERILVSRDRRLAGATAPPQGLHLWSVRYDPRFELVGCAIDGESDRGGD